MSKFTLKEAAKAVGIGSFVEKTIIFRGVGGEDQSGEIKIKVLTSEEVSKVTDVLKLKKDEKYTLAQYRDAMLFAAVYDTDEKPFFANLKDTGIANDEIKAEMYKVADEVINFTGKYWISMKKQNSSANSSSTELAENQSQKQEQT